jgi:hypothetical protein
LRSSVKLWRAFRETEPTRARVICYEMPKTLAVMGKCTRIEYTTSHGSKAVLYGHDFAPGSRPYLCASPDGRLFLIKGHYTVTGRGTVDTDPSGREKPERRLLNPTKRRKR